MPSRRKRGILRSPFFGGAAERALWPESLYIVGALAYLGLSALWLYGIVDRGLIERSEWLSWSVIAGVAAAHVLFGFAIREWAALLLPIAVLFLAIPAGYPESQFSEPLLVWLSQVFLVIVEIPLIAAGLGLRALGEGRRRTHRAC